MGLSRKRGKVARKTRVQNRRSSRRSRSRRTTQVNRNNNNNNSNRRRSKKGKRSRRRSKRVRGGNGEDEGCCLADPPRPPPPSAPPANEEYWTALEAHEEAKKKPGATPSALAGHAAKIMEIIPGVAFNTYNKENFVIDLAKLQEDINAAYADCLEIDLAKTKISYKQMAPWGPGQTVGACQNKLNDLLKNKYAVLENEEIFKKSADGEKIACVGVKLKINEKCKFSAFILNGSATSLCTLEKLDHMQRFLNTPYARRYLKYGPERGWDTTYSDIVAKKPCPTGI